MKKSILIVFVLMFKIYSEDTDLRVLIKKPPGEMLIEEEDDVVFFILPPPLLDEDFKSIEIYEIDNCPDIKKSSSTDEYDDVFLKDLEKTIDKEFDFQSPSEDQIQAMQELVDEFLDESFVTKGEYDKCKFSNMYGENFIKDDFIFLSSLRRDVNEMLDELPSRANFAIRAFPVIFKPIYEGEKDFDKNYIRELFTRWFIFSAFYDVDFFEEFEHVSENYCEKIKDVIERFAFKLSDKNTIEGSDSKPSDLRTLFEEDEKRLRKLHEEFKGENLKKILGEISEIVNCFIDCE